MQILIMSHFLVMRWVFILQILIILNLMMIVLINIILKLVFMLGLWLGVINIYNAKRDKQKILKKEISTCEKDIR